MSAYGVRFAPSPTGEFHLGNLRSAWISFQLARKFSLPWILRFEDIDQPRVVEGALERQTEAMASLGMKADRSEVQSRFRARHWALLIRAIQEGAAYPCFCSRKEVAESLRRMASAPHAKDAVYDGSCRSLKAFPKRMPHETLAWRFRSDDPSGTRDFIVARTAPISKLGCQPEISSFVPGYHWACAIDDFDGRYELLVRAWDLAPVTELQRSIQSWVARSEGVEPRFAAVFHCALVTQNDGKRLEKRTRGVTLAELHARGEANESILQKFDSSFRTDLTEIEPGGLYGEARKTLTLAELGF